MCARAAGVMLGSVVSKSLSGCVGLGICVCGAPCVRASGAGIVSRQVAGLLVWIVCAAVSAAGVAAVCWKAGCEAVLGVPVCPRADG